MPKNKQVLWGFVCGQGNSERGPVWHFASAIGYPSKQVATFFAYQQMRKHNVPPECAYLSFVTNIPIQKELPLPKAELGSLDYALQDGDFEGMDAAEQTRRTA